MFCRGSMVELLVTSRISRYAEFKAVSRILTVIDDKLEQVSQEYHELGCFPILPTTFVSLIQT